MRVRVYWMYRPDDLPNGRQPYHGENELIASNHMDVIEAQAIQSKANLEHWDEEADQDGPPNADLYWRQTYDVSTRRLSVCSLLLPPISPRI